MHCAALKPPLSPLTEGSETDAADTSNSSIGTLRALYTNSESGVLQHSPNDGPPAVRHHGSTSSSSQASTVSDEHKQRENRIGSWTSSLLSVGRGSSSSSSAGTASTLPTPEPSPRGKRFGLLSPVKTIEEPVPTILPGDETCVAAGPRKELPPAGSSGRTREKTVDALEAEMDAAFADSSEILQPVATQREEQRTLSAQSDFSVSAYTYSPHLGGSSKSPQLGLSPQLCNQKSRWSLRSGESSRVPLLGLGLGTPSCQASSSQPRERQVSAVLSTTSSRGDSSGGGLAKVKEKVRSRKRAITVSNAEPAREREWEAQSKAPVSPARAASHKQQAGFATLTARQRALFAADYKLYPVSPTHVVALEAVSRPPTAELGASPTSSIFKPLPAIPSPGGAGKVVRPRTGGSSSSSRPGMGSRKASSANLRAAGSRPGTGSTAAKALGLVATPPLGFTEVVRSSWAPSSTVGTEYQSVHSRDSLDSGSAEQSQGPEWAGPPASISIHIDQEKFRNIALVFKLSESESTPGKAVYLAAQPGKAYPYHYAAMDPAPVLRAVQDGQGQPLVSREASLPIKQSGAYTVEGSEGKESISRWKFTYQVCDRTSLVGRALPGEKVRRET